MFVSMVLNTEYMDYDSRKIWYLKNLLHCKKNGWILITHEYLKVHFEELQKQIDDRFFEEFEMKPFKKEELKNIEQYFIPDEIFEDLKNRFDSRTEMLMYLHKNSDPKLETFLKKTLNKVLLQHPNKNIEGIFHCLDSFKTIKKISVEYRLPLISYVFSAIRKVHGYRETLFCANIAEDIFCSEQCETRYTKFIKEETTFPILENKEIIALLGKPKTFPLIPLINKKPKFEICICGETYSILPHVFMSKPYTDEDIFYECKSLYPKSSIINRQHPFKLDQLQINRTEFKHDPAAYILSAKRVTAVCSQIILKAILWNRVAVMKKNTLPFSFACEKQYDSNNKVDLVFLNYYIFCYLVPSELMFNEDYWLWRLKENPLESEIYNKHIEFYLDKFSLDRDIFYKNDNKYRFKEILKNRDCDEYTISNLLSQNKISDFNYKNAISRISIEDSLGSVKNYWSLNSYNNYIQKSNFKLTVKEDLETMLFYPLDDKAGFVSINEINVIQGDSKNMLMKSKESFVFYPQNNGYYKLDLKDFLGNIEIEIIWDYKNVYEYAKL